MDGFLNACSFFDYLLIGIAIFWIIRGFIRGSSGELGNLIGLLCGTLVLTLGRQKLSEMVVSFFPTLSGNVFIHNLLTLAFAVVVAVSIWLLLGAILSRLIKLIIPQPIDGILGGFIGVFKLLLLVWLLCLYGVVGKQGKAQGEENTGFIARHSTLVQSVGPLVWSMMDRQGKEESSPENSGEGKEERGRSRS